MNEQKKPQPGEWWIRYDGMTGYIAGFDPDGDPVYVYRNGDATNCDTMDGFCESWRHLPDCTGWDWEPPMQSVPGTVVGTVRVTPLCTCPTIDGMQITGSGCLIHGLPKATLDLQSSTTPETPAESPDDWVTQDRVPPRANVDQIQWSTWAHDRWVVASGTWPATMPYGDKVYVRCRRKDLPPVPEPEPPVESPDDWVEILEPDHVLRDCDEMDATGSVVSDNSGIWLGIAHYAGTSVAMWRKRDAAWRFRCRRKDLPPVPEPAVDTPQQERPDGPLTRMIKETAECMACTRCGEFCEKTHAQQFIEPDNRTPNDPLSWPHSTQKKRTTVRMFVPRRVLDEPEIDYPVRCCFSQSGIKDVATWVEVKHDGNRFFVDGD